MKTAVAQRVVVMGREGPARDQLITALSELGVTPVWVGKPVQSNPEQLAEMNPNRVIVSLEPLIEVELEPYSDFLSQPSVTVLYDDAEITGGLSGWDLKRWARHMAAKLLGRDVLPPAPPGSVPEAVEAESPFSGSLPSWNVSETDQQAADGADDSAEPPAHAAWQVTEHYETLEIDSDELNAELEKLSQNLSKGFNRDEILDLSFEQKPVTEQELSFATEAFSNKTFSSELELSLVDFDDEPDESASDRIGGQSKPPAPEFQVLEEFALQDADTSHGVVPVSGLTESPADSDALLAFQSEDDYAAFFSELTNQSAQIPNYDLSKLSLEGDERSDGPGSAAGSGVHGDDSDLPNLKTMFLVISGLGGPVAVRTLLGQINTGFSGILAVAHDIEAGQLPKLRDQFQKITEVPISIPESEEFLKTGNIYLLPKKHTLLSTSLGYQCIPGASLAGYIDQMDHNAEILILSGADALLAQQLIQVSALINNIHVQSPEDCFEPTLAQILVNVGAPVMSQDVTAQWFN
jgi:chemosensory pili system protein ChpB (putative protein-glutamate methylesterase)